MSTQKPTSPSAGEQLSKVAEAANDQLGKAADQMQSVAQTAVDQAREVVDKSSEVFEAVERNVKEQPLLALAVVAIAGFALGAVWKLGDRS